MLISHCSADFGYSAAFAVIVGRSVRMASSAAFFVYHFARGPAFGRAPVIQTPKLGA